MCPFRIAFALVALSITGTVVWSVPEAQQFDKVALAEKVAGANLDLVQAVDRAQGEVPMGKLLAVRLEKKNEQVRYGTYFFEEGVIKEVEIDPDDGHVLQFKEVLDDFQVGEELLSDARTAATEGNLELLLAIRMAADKFPDARPIEAEWRMEDGQPIAEVELLRNGKITKMWFDAVSSKEIRVKNQ